MIVYISLDGVDWNVYGIPDVDKFHIYAVMARGCKQNIQHLLREDFLERLQEAATESAQCEIPFPPDVVERDPYHEKVDRDLVEHKNGDLERDLGAAEYFGKER
jgi:hypothetical protein